MCLNPIYQCVVDDIDSDFSRRGVEISTWGLFSREQQVLFVGLAWPRCANPVALWRVPPTIVFASHIRKNYSFAFELYTLTKERVCYCFFDRQTSGTTGPEGSNLNSKHKWSAQTGCLWLLLLCPAKLQVLVRFGSRAFLFVESLKMPLGCVMAHNWSLC